jgi:uncharacterized protein
MKLISFLLRLAGARLKIAKTGANMKGFQLEFFTQQDSFHGNKHLSDWLVELARRQGIYSAMVFTSSSGFEEGRRFQAAHMFDLIDHPVQVTMILSEAQCDNLFNLLQGENLHLFYVKLPVEYGRVGD